MTFDIAMLSSAHPAQDDRIFYREAKTLAEAGYSVCVVARQFQSEIVDGIHIRALPTAKSRLERLLLGRSVLALAREADARLYIVHDPELIGIGLILRAMGKGVIYDAHENVPAQLLQKEWLPKLFRWLLYPLVAGVEGLASRLLSGVIAAVPAIQQRFPKSRTELIRNFPTRTALATLHGGLPLEQRANVVLYTGGLSAVRGIRELVEAFRGLNEAELWLVGNFDDERFRDQVLASLPKNVLWLGWRPHIEVLRIYRLAKVGAVLLHSTPNHRCALPVKLFEYMGAGLPVVASNFPEYTELVEGCGVQVNPADPEEIRNTIRTMLSDEKWLREMSEKARQRVLVSFSWEQEGRRLINFCEVRMQKKINPEIALLPTRARNS